MRLEKKVIMLFCLGKSIHDNPYFQDEDYANAWAKGWLEAESEYYWASYDWRY